MTSSRSEMESALDTRLDNVFADENPAPREQAGGDMLSLTPAPYGNTGGSFDGEAPDFEASLTAETSLREHLAAQLDLATASPSDRLIGSFLIDAVDEAGYLRESIDAVSERLGARLDDVARVLRLVQTFDPPGIAARDLAECLAIQLREQNRFDPAMEALVSRSTSWPSAIFPPCASSAASTTRIWSRCSPRSAGSIPSPAAPSAPKPSRC